MEGEFEGEGEFELEGEMEAMTSNQATAEFMAAVAASAQSEAEAEAMAGAATVASIRGEDLATLRRVLPSMVEGTAVLTRMVASSSFDGPAVRLVPTVVRRTARTLVRRAAAGQPVTRRSSASHGPTNTNRPEPSTGLWSSPATQCNSESSSGWQHRSRQLEKGSTIPRPRTGQPRRRTAVPTLG